MLSKSNRWPFIVSALWIAIITVGGAVTGETNDFIIKTKQGRLMGAPAETSHSGITVFKGIPYAIPPVGERRWKHAEAAPAWKGVRDATRFGPDCIQPPALEGSFYYTTTPMQSEDCLYLNVWTGGTAGDKRPVMVWIHGGGFAFGSGAKPSYDGTELARKGVVLVTLNYRMGLFGNYIHPDLSAESPVGASGNYGWTDQIQALKWVQQNIEAFGGDPNNVTIFGESAGGRSVHLLLASPLIRGLIHKAISESGVHNLPNRYLKKPYLDRPSAEHAGLDFAQKAGGLTLADLRAMPAQTLLKLSSQHHFLTSAEYPVVDGWFLTDQVDTIYAEGQQMDVPVIIGFTANEGGGLADFGLIPEVPKNKAAYIAEAKERFGNLADDYLRLYPGDNLIEDLFNSYRDDDYTGAMQRWARQVSEKLTSDAYLYYFSHIPPGCDVERPFPLGGKNKWIIGAYHASEIPYVFNNVAKNSTLSPNIPSEPATKTDLGLANTMSDYWVAFAKTGKPSSNGNPVWQPYAKDQAFMEFNKGAQPGHNLMPEELKLYEAMVARKYKNGMYWTHGEMGFNNRTERPQT